VAKAREKYLYLTTRGRKSGLPREIEIWFTSRGESYYVIAEHPTSHWVQNLRTDARVQVRVGGKSFAASARVVSEENEPELHRSVQQLFREKYGWGEGLVFELVRDTN
jgi:deazaflavin-dependent oxidoreductase (nitroreductase family)